MLETRNIDVRSAPDTQSPLATMRAFVDAQSLLHRCTPEHLENAIAISLQMIGQAMGADRAYIFRIKDAVSVDNTHEWCAAGITPLKAQLQRLPYEMGDPFWQAFRTSGRAFIVDINNVPAGTAFRQLLEEQEIKSLIASSLWCNGDLVGLVGLDFVRGHRVFTDLEDSQMLGFAAAIGLAQSRAEQSRVLLRTRSELQRERARVAAMVSTLPELLVETDSEGTIVGFNQSDPLVFALNPDEVIGRAPEGVLPQRVAKIVRKAMKQVDHFGWSHSFSYTLPFPEGEKRFTLTATRRHRDDPYKAHGYLFVVRDVTESYVQDRQIRQLGRVAELSTNLIMLADKDRLVTWMNPASVARTGYAVKAALGCRPSHILHLHETAPDLVGNFCQMLDNGHSINAEVQARSRRGVSYWLDLNIQPLRSPEGYVQGYMVVGVDITSHKLAEARALRDKVHAMEATREGIAILFPDGRFSYLNCAFRKVLGVARDTDISTLYWHELVAPQHMETLSGIWADLLNEGYWADEVMLPDADGQDAWYDLSLSVQDDGSIFALVRNVTARRLAEVERQRLREQLQIAQSRQLTSQLASGLAHDFANILATIVGSVDILQPKAGTDMAPGLARIHAAGLQGQALVANLMKLARMKPAAGMINLPEVLNQSVELVRPGLGKEIAVMVDCGAKPAIAQADGTEMMQVFINLIMNAADAIRQQGPEGGKITLRIETHDSILPVPAVDIGKVAARTPYIVIDISDTGTGISPANRSDLFKPYFTTKGDAGTGLGLVIVAHIVTARNWGLQVLDGPDGGTTMRLFLPVPTPAGQDGRGAVLLAGQPLLDRHILLVDADDRALQVMAEILTAAGAEVASSTDPHDALDALREDPQAWDTVVISQDLEPISGIELAKELKAVNCKLQVFVTLASQELRFANYFDSELITAVVSRSVSGAELVAALSQAPQI
ncbi:PAS domain-containing protein [Roseinatronobacter sp. NSM]|uniref:PAS domain-containing protein n=1 Tax=Roseinatronobacter sp. NSM TaxID=3457785 RepID=UPI004035A174